MKIGIIADDITGSNDIGIMCKHAGLETVIYDVEDKLKTESYSSIIVNTNSRITTPKIASSRVLQAFNKLVDEECDVFYKKTCSVFRGNIGIEFDTVQNQMDQTMHVILGFPDMGRTTIDGIHFVDGVEIAQSQFATDPVNPLKTSKLSDIISEQSNGRIANVSYQNYIDKRTFKNYIKQLERDNEYIIYDVRNNSDLQFLANVLSDKKLFGGASAFAQYLGRVNNKQSGTFICVGSMTPQSKSQVEFMESKATVIKPTIEELVNGLELLINEICDCIVDKQTVILTSHNCKPEDIESYLNEDISKQFATITAKVVEKTELQSIIVGGGETSGLIAKALGIKGQEIVGEVSTGVAMCRAVNNSNFKFIFKSGSFGEVDFLEKAIIALNS